jgi:hypothetical protein
MKLLILLVGTNPLPNWVTFSYVFHEAPVNLKPQKVIVVHSAKTAPQANRLQQKMVGLVEKAQLCDIGVDAGDAQKIYDAVRKSVVDEGTDTVHLDYTGGTKQMVVQTFAVVQDLKTIGKIVESRFSYLDATKHRLRFDNGDIEPVGGSDLRGRVTVSLKDLVALHGCELKPRNNDVLGGAPLWPLTTRAIWVAVSSDDMQQKYKAWLSKSLSAHSEREYKDLRKQPVALPTDELLPIASNFLQELKLEPGSSGVAWNDIDKYFDAQNAKQRVRTAEKVAKYFDGVWLEGHVWRALEEQMNGRGQKPFWSVQAERVGSSGDPAEMDVAIIFGFQLFLFSCTTATQKALVKSKAFEAIHRAKQFGGDAARPFLVTLLPHEAANQAASVQNVLEDIETDVGHGEGPRVWGIRDLKTFDETWQNLRNEEALP